MAYYDLGKVEQEMKISIGSGATLSNTTNDGTRNLVDIITVDDLGITNAAYGVNNNNAEIQVSTGTSSWFTSDNYDDNKYNITTENGNYVLRRIDEDE